MTNEPYGMDDLNLDLSTIEWVDEAVWVEGSTADGRDVSAGFDPVNVDPTGADPETDDDGLAFRAFARLQWLHDTESEEYLEIAQP